MKKRLLLLLTALTVFSVSANAAVVLTVDLTVLNQITITATDGASSVTTSGSDTTGVYLTSIFDSPFPTGIIDTLISGDLTSAANGSDGTPAIFTSGFTPGDGLNIWSYTDDPTSDFIAGEIAFSGSATWEIGADAYASLLAGPAGGDVYAFADDDGDLAGAMIIGEWERATPIPVPAAVWLLGSALLGLRAFSVKK